MNLEQVARRAKVSTATVSRVLNNASVVKTSTRTRVMKAIEELRYHPNLHARSLAGGKSRTFGRDRLQYGKPVLLRHLQDHRDPTRTRARLSKW